MRYAEVLLIAGEALARLSKPAKKQLVSKSSQRACEKLGRKKDGFPEEVRDWSDQKLN